MTKHKYSDLDKDSLAMHRAGRPGKVEVVATKPLTTQRDREDIAAAIPLHTTDRLEIALDDATLPAQVGLMDLEKYLHFGELCRLSRSQPS